ncbi:MAG: hypothetical protein KGY54_00610, partial [Oleiphilaceae bacterium]|nr:hypothetical protein [Oleiphilaceae bacterium]
MTRRRRFAIWILILLLLVLIAGGFWLRQTWHEFRQSNGIRQLDWQGFDLSRDGISLERLSVLQEQAGRRVQAEAEGLTLRWRWRGPRLEDVAMDRLEIDWRSPKNAGAAGELPPLGLPEQPPAWLPQQFTLEEFHANLPCDTGRCELNGGLAVSRQHSLLPLTAELQLNHEGHHVRFDARLGGELDDTLELVAAITIDDTRHLELTSSYQPQNDDGLSHWSGTLDVPELPQADWLLAWLQQWQPVPLDDLPPQPEAGTLRTSWQLRGPMATTDFLARVSGTVTAGASLPEPWPIPGVATSRGTFELALVADEGQWLAKTARADLHFSQFAGWIKPLPETLRPTSLLLEIRPADADSQPSGSRTLLPLKVTLTTQGPSPLELDSNLALAMTAPWLVELGETRITASLADRSQAGWSVRGASADVSFTGRADTSSLNLDFGNGSTLALKRVDNGKAQEPIELQDARVDVSRLKVSAGYSLDEPALEKLNYSGPIAVAVRQFKQALVHTHSWELEGDINGDAGQVWLSGTLKASTGAQGDFSLDYPFAGDLEAEVKAEASGESGAEAWAGVIALWPENLMVDSGNVEAEASLWLPAGLEPTVNGGVSFSDLSGIHDRMAFSDLNGRVAFNLRGSWINLEAP